MRQKDRERERETDIQTEIETHRHTETHAHRGTHTDRHTQNTHRDTHTDKDTQTYTHKHTRKDRHAHTDRQTHRQTHRQKNLSSIASFLQASNAIFVVLPCLLLYLFHPFARCRSWRVQFVWILTMVIGISSAYFHATLSLAGQLLDEFGILWVIGAGIAFWTPRTLLPKYFQQRE